MSCTHHGGEIIFMPLYSRAIDTVMLFCLICLWSRFKNYTMIRSSNVKLEIRYNETGPVVKYVLCLYM